MKRSEKALLLVGSPRGGSSTSQVLGANLLEYLDERGVASESFQVSDVVESRDGFARFLAALEKADLLLLSFPVYFDSLPAITIRFLERLAEGGREIPYLAAKRLVVIANSGFPEAWQSNTAVAICRKFALEVGFPWAGALSLGGGAAIDGRPLESMGGMMRHVREALELAAAALAAGEDVPREAVDLMAKPFMPSWAYLSTGGLGWRRKARRRGLWKGLDDPVANGSRKPEAG